MPIKHDWKKYAIVDAETGENIQDKIVWADVQLGVYCRFAYQNKRFLVSEADRKQVKRELVHRKIKIVLKPECMIVNDDDIKDIDD